MPAVDPSQADGRAILVSNIVAKLAERRADGWAARPPSREAFDVFAKSTTLALLSSSQSRPFVVAVALLLEQHAVDLGQRLLLVAISPIAGSDACAIAFKLPAIARRATGRLDRA